MDDEVVFVAAYNMVHRLGTFVWRLADQMIWCYYNNPEECRLKEKLRVHEARRVMAGMKP